MLSRSTPTAIKRALLEDILFAGLRKAGIPARMKARFPRVFKPDPSFGRIVERLSDKSNRYSIWTSVT
jgi:hypothetical protein